MFKEQGVVPPQTHVSLFVLTAHSETFQLAASVQPGPVLARRIIEGVLRELNVPVCVYQRPNKDPVELR